MKKLVLALAVALIAAPAALASRTVYVRDVSQVVDQAEVQSDMVAFTAALGDWGSVWGKKKVNGVRVADAELVLLPARVQAPAKSWTITINDYPNCWCYGFHDVTNKVPYAEVGTAGNWTVTFTHELFEMMTDPYVNYFHAVGRLRYIVEVGDPPEDDSFAYSITWMGVPVLVSDFVTPAWYRPGSRGPYDFKNHISKPLQVLCGGYVSWLFNGQWGSYDASPC